jgi:hypothetical protein
LVPAALWLGCAPGIAGLVLVLGLVALSGVVWLEAAEGSAGDWLLTGGVVPVAAPAVPACDSGLAPVEAELGGVVDPFPLLQVSEIIFTLDTLKLSPALTLPLGLEGWPLALPDADAPAAWLPVIWISCPTCWARLSVLPVS